MLCRRRRRYPLDEALEICATVKYVRDTHFLASCACICSV